MDGRKRKDDTSLARIRITNPLSSIKVEETLLGGHQKITSLFVSSLCNGVLNFL